MHSFRENKTVKISSEESGAISRNFAPAKISAIRYTIRYGLNCYVLKIQDGKVKPPSQIQIGKIWAWPGRSCDVQYSIR